MHFSHKRSHSGGEEEEGRKHTSENCLFTIGAVTESKIPPVSSIWFSAEGTVSTSWDDFVAPGREIDVSAPSLVSTFALPFNPGMRLEILPRNPELEALEEHDRQ